MQAAPRAGGGGGGGGGAGAPAAPPKREALLYICGLCSKEQRKSSVDVVRCEAAGCGYRILYKVRVERRAWALGAAPLFARARVEQARSGFAASLFFSHARPRSDPIRGTLSCEKRRWMLHAPSLFPRRRARRSQAARRRDAFALACGRAWRAPCALARAARVVIKQRAP